MGACLSSNNTAISFNKISDRFETFEQLQQALHRAGLESSELIFAIDVTKSNTWNGKHCYQEKSLHHPYPVTAVSSSSYQSVKDMNPYTFIMSAISKTLAAFDTDQNIPAYYFGDSRTTDQSCQSFFQSSSYDGKSEPYGHGIESVIQAYHRIMPHLSMAGPTSFAPVIQKAMDIVQQTGKYHILVIITDGQVDNLVREQQMIARASYLPLSICVVGLGDFQFDDMNKLDDGEYGRQFDNLQFVNLNQVLGPKWYDHIHSAELSERQSLDLATAILMEVPEQFKWIKQHMKSLRVYPDPVMEEIDGPGA